ncbi:GNAT family N-acetyltransferase [Bacillus sp. FJAT-49736]|uniref:GNAT family N-acetyltransferase n=1 Tax=Bacillus sp. FJAT-49736 TaxID=2833582 RepID=UPI001BC986F2|nr:GNAT family N-acetyltransferase [Bacillus sp. FJAT-49736]MBS4172341.1 GNAT family N-acetyltransferase [Bacillus sp. FJAT-49736]
MIKKLTSSHHEQVMEFLMEEPSMNLFIIGDIESFGYDSEFQELWGDFSPAGELRGVLLRYYHSYIPYGKADFDLEGFIEILKKDPDFKLSGIEKIVGKFEEAIQDNLGKKQVTYFCECTKEHFSGVSADLAAVKKAKINDIDRILELRAGIQEFVPNPHAKEMMEKGMEIGTARTYFMEVNGEMVASASTTAENSLSAMIVGVCTAVGHRKKGYASVVMEKLMEDIFTEGKTLCLFYDNPEAGRIYKRLGFKDIGMWTMYR